jgi:kinesin family protein 3/17
MPVNIYARIRPMLPFEFGQANIVDTDEGTLSLVPPIGDTSFKPITFTFTAISEQGSTNEDCFVLIAEPMVQAVLEGFDAVLMAYGQTGCGKTYTMLGKPSRGIVGLIPRCSQFILENEKNGPRPIVQLSVVEAYSTSMKKIEFFDLLQPYNNDVPWDKMKGSTNLETKNAIQIKIANTKMAYDNIVRAQNSGHLAPTGKNPESSRGHTFYLIKCTPQQDEDSVMIIPPATFVFIDLAGSEGETALAPEFCATHSKEDVMTRRMEGGVINSGLSAIQAMFRELGKTGKIAKIGRVGVRRILCEYIDASCHLSVMFMLSPAHFNAAATTSTLTFAKAASLIKVKPEKRAKKVNWAKVAKMQEKQITQLNLMKEKMTKLLAGEQEELVEDVGDGGDKSQQYECRSEEKLMAAKIKDLNPYELEVRILNTQTIIETVKRETKLNTKNVEAYIDYLQKKQASLQSAVEKLVKRIEKQMKAWEKQDHPERYEMPLD